MTKQNHELVTFSLDDNVFAIPLHHVRKVIRAVAVTHVPDVGHLLHGIFNFHGEVKPVINLRSRFMLNLKEISPTDRFIICDTPERSFAIVVDEVEEIIKIAESDLNQVDTFGINQDGPKTLQEQQPTLLAQNRNGIIIIFDIEKLLTSSLKIQLDQLMEIQKEEKIV